MPEVLTGLGVLGLVAAVALASLFCLVQPVWALIDCVDSNRDRESKVLISIAIFFTWGVGSLVYGLFFARSRNLRGFTVVAMLVLMGLGVASFGSCVSGIATQARRAASLAEERQGEAVRRAAAFQPPAAAADAVAPFHAILFARSGAHSATTSLAEFTSSWEAFTNRVLDAPYTVLDGTTPLESVTVDQRQPPVGFFEKLQIPPSRGFFLPFM